MQTILTYCLLSIALVAVLLMLNQTSMATPERTMVAPVSARIIADVDAIEPGKDFHVGVLFNIQSGWHIYWKNPGDAGLATSVKFILPDGFIVGKLRWPHPQTFKLAGDITAYGYEKSVLLYATVTAPADLKVGMPVAIKADVNWQGCENVCLPGEAKLDMILDVTRISRLANLDLFSEWKSRTDPVAPAFALIDQDGKVVKLSDYSSRIVVLEWMNADCPFVKYHYRPDVKTMISLAERYKDKGVVWLAINSTNYWTNQKGQIFRMENQLPYPILNDREGLVGHAYQAKTTPHMFIVDTDGLIVYQGAIDNSPLGKLEASTKPINYVEAALDELLAGKPVSVGATKSYGCSVKFAN